MSSERLANFEQFAIDVILERRKGKRANLLRAGLWFLSGAFRAVVQARLWLYRNCLGRRTRASLYACRRAGAVAAGHALVAARFDAVQRRRVARHRARAVANAARRRQ